MKVVVLASLLVAAYGAAAKCGKEDGVADEAKAGDDGCFCGGDAESADTPKCAKDKYCAKTSDGKFQCLDAKLTDKCTAGAENTDKAVCGCEKADAAGTFVTLCIKTDTCKGEDGSCTKKAAEAKKCAKEDGTDAAPAEKCFCGGDAKSDANPECAEGKFCLKKDDKFSCADTKAEAATATTTAAATTAAATTAAAGAGTTAAAAAGTTAVMSPAAAEAAAKAAHKAAVLLVNAVTDATAKAALLVGAPTGVTIAADVAPKVEGTGASKVLKVEATMEDPNSMTPAAKAATDAFFCKAMSLTDKDMCAVTYTKARRLQEGRQLAAAKYNVEVKMKSEADYAAVKKQQAEAAQKTLSSGASAFGIAVAMGLVALY